MSFLPISNSLGANWKGNWNHTAYFLIARNIVNGFYESAEKGAVGGLLNWFLKKDTYAEFRNSFRSLLEKMLDKDPAARPIAFEVWEATRKFSEILKVAPQCLCHGVPASGSPTFSEPSKKEDDVDDSSSDGEGDCSF